MQTTPFTRGAKKVRREVRTTSASIKGLGADLGTIGPRMLAMIAPTALATKALAGMRAELEKIDKIAKSSRSLDISTQALAGYELAAELSGTSLETFEKSLSKMTRSVGEARVGIGEAREEFGRLGLDVNRLAGQSVDKTFQDIADALNGVDNSFDKARAGQAIFGRGFKELLPLIEMGSTGMMDARQEAIDLGLAFGKDAAGGVEKFNDELTRLEKALTGLKRTLSTSFGGALVDALESFNKLLRDRPQILGFPFGGIFGTAISLSARRRRASRGRAAVDEGGAEVFDDAAELARAKKDADEFSRKMREADAAFKAIEDRAESIRKAFRSPIEVFRETIDDLRELRKTLGPAFEDTFRRAARGAVDTLMMELKREMPDIPAGNVASPSAGRPGFTAALEESRRSARRAERWRAESLASARRREDLLRRIEDKLPLELDSTDLR